MDFDYYFAYGSNLSHTFLNDRLTNSEWIRNCGENESFLQNPEFLGVYKLEGYEFGYTLRDGEETTGNIIKKEGATVFGALYKISKVQFQALDIDENVPEQYTKTLVKVNRVASAVFNAPPCAEAFAYVGNKNYFTTDINPDPLYVELLTKAAEELSFPRWYVEKYFLFPVLR